MVDMEVFLNVMLLTWIPLTIISGHRFIGFATFFLFDFSLYKFLYRTGIFQMIYLDQG